LDKRMLLAGEKQKLDKFNKYCLNYNLVAQAVYEQLKKGVGPFSKEYRSFIIAALVFFDMGEGDKNHTPYCSRQNCSA